MKEYPFLFALNIATAENNITLRHAFSSDRIHELHSTHSL